MFYRQKLTNFQATKIKIDDNSIEITKFELFSGIVSFLTSKFSNLISLQNNYNVFSLKSCALKKFRTFSFYSIILQYSIPFYRIEFFLFSVSIFFIFDDLDDIVGTSPEKCESTSSVAVIMDYLCEKKIFLVQVKRIITSYPI